MDTVREVLAIDHLAALWLPLALATAFTALGLFAVTLTIAAARLRRMR